VSAGMIDDHDDHNAGQNVVSAGFGGRPANPLGVDTRRPVPIPGYSCGPVGLG
jgi:hypothetical protein